MKKTDMGLSFGTLAREFDLTFPQRMGRAALGLGLVLGLWGTAGAFLTPVTALAAAAVLLIALAPRNHGIALLAMLAGFGVFALAFGGQIVQGLGAMANAVAEVMTTARAYYYPRFATDGPTWQAQAAVGMALGCAAVGVVSMKSAAGAIACCVAVLTGCHFGLLEGNAWLGLYLLATVLLMVRWATGSIRQVILVGSALAAFCGCLLLAPPQAEDNPLGAMIHRWRFEDGSSPLPEGQVADAGSFRPGTKAALEVTMTEFEPMYLRGFVGGGYNGSGWDAPEVTDAELMYTLQKTYFYPQTQLSAANAALEETSDNQVKVTTRGACGMYAYLPYGIAVQGLDPRDLDGERLDSFTGTLAPVADSYLIQEQLSGGGGTAQYRDAEAAYRELVYAQYLALPADTLALLEKQFDLPGEQLSTSDAREQVLSWLDESMTYDELVSKLTADSDLAANLLTVSHRGWSVHYATLGTLMLRSLGVPARYVEGYLLSKELCSGAEDGQTLVLTQENAHAWVEYYLDGVGWIPFDVTPGHENEIHYQLPSDGTGTQKPQAPEPPEETEPPVEQENDPGAQTRLKLVKLVRNLLLICAVAVVLGGLLTIVFLRRRLRKRVAALRADGSRESLLDNLRYQEEILKTMGLPAGDDPLSELRALPEVENGRQILSLARELSYSDHPVTEQQHQTLLESLDRITAVWKEKTPARRRFVLKWLRCRVL